MSEALKYGLNPQQSEATVRPSPGAHGNPIEILNGRPSYINYLDALNAWNLVREIDEALGLPAAASFKHVSPAGVAVDGEIDRVIEQTYGVDSEDLSTIARTYLRARDADPKCSYGDFIAVSRKVDESLASVLGGLFSDGIIAPEYDGRALERLKSKKRGAYVILKADPSFAPPSVEERDVHGMRLSQTRDHVRITPELVRHASSYELSSEEIINIVLGEITLRYTQSNSVCFVRDGLTIGIGAGQQSRVDCTRLAGAKADTWWLRRYAPVADLAFRSDLKCTEKINWQVRYIEGDLTTRERQALQECLTVPLPEMTQGDREEWVKTMVGVTFLSDGFLPFSDNIEHAAKHGVGLVVEPGGSMRSDDVEKACNELNIRLIRTDLRLFHH